MEGIYILFTIMAVVCLIAFVLIAFLLGKLAGPKMELETSPKPKAVNSKPTFIRENQVCGHLLVDGHKIPTFNTGILDLDNTVGIAFFKPHNSAVRILDIRLNGASIYSFATAGSTPELKADYAIQVLKQSANQQAIDFDLALEVEQILMEVEAFNGYIQSGKVVQLPGSYDFAWRAR